MEQTGTKAKGTDGLDCESQRNSWVDGWGFCFEKAGDER